MSLKASGQLQDQRSHESRLDFDEEVAVLVGEKEQRFTLYKKIVCGSSDFFQCCCKNQWKEGAERIVRLPEAEPDVFAVYVCWIYTGEVDIVSKEGVCEMSTPKYSTEMPPSEYRALALQLVQCSKMADILQDQTFANAVVDEFVFLSGRSGFVPSPQIVRAAWPGPPHKSGFIRAVVDLVAVHASKESFAKHAPQYPADFVIETMQACIRDRSLTLASRGIYGRERCFYHDHVEGNGKTMYCGRPAMKGQRKTAREDDES